MLNLFERLKSELRKDIESEKELYPLSCERLKKDLSEVFWVVDLRYDNVINLESRAKRLNIPFSNAWDFFINE
jgi:hypothetical protein